MFAILLCLLIAFSIALGLTPAIIRLAHKHGIFDQFDERKVHTQKTPRFGGAAIYLGTSIATLVMGAVAGHPIHWSILAAATVITLVGSWDDYQPISHRYKLVPEVLASLAVIYLADLHIVSLDGLFGVTDIPVWLGYLLAIFTIVVITNAVNLIDGIDGLAGTLAIVFFGGYGAWFFLAGDPNTSLLCVGLVGASAAFLYFNFRKQIFMGDTGSLMIGFLAAVITLQFLRSNAGLPVGHAFKMASPVLFTCSALALPLFDTLRVFVIRIASGRSPFSADKNHLHHLLLALRLPHYQATLILCGSNLVFMVAAYLAQGIDTNLGLVAALLVAIGASFLLKKQAEVQPAFSAHPRSAGPHPPTQSVNETIVRRSANN